MTAAHVLAARTAISARYVALSLTPAAELTAAERAEWSAEARLRGLIYVAGVEQWSRAHVHPSRRGWA